MRITWMHTISFYAMTALVVIMLMDYVEPRGAYWQPDHPDEIIWASDSMLAIQILLPSALTKGLIALVRIRIFLGDSTADILVPYTPDHWQPGPPSAPELPDTNTTSPGSDPPAVRGDHHGKDFAIH